RAGGTARPGHGRAGEGRGSRGARAVRSPDSDETAGRTARARRARRVPGVRTGELRYRSVLRSGRRLDPVAGLRGAAYLDLACLGGLRLRHRHMQYAIGHFGRDLVAIHELGKTN